MCKKIKFSIGDPSCDGHCISEEYHVTVSHSTEEIEEAYNRATKKLGWDFLKEIAVDYEENRIYLDSINDLQEKLNIDIKLYLDNWQLSDLERKNYCYLDPDSFVNIFFAIVSSEIQDFDYFIELFENEEKFYLLDGTGYGLFSA